MNLIAQGAEARVYLDEGKIVKERVAKTWRHPTIDSGLRGSRTRREAKILETLSRVGFPSPRLGSMDDTAGTIIMERIPGEKLRDVIHTAPTPFGRGIGRLLGMLHNMGITHGDPTTSNMIVREGNIHLIDFGLSQFSIKIEDKAVDLHLLDRAVESAHHTVHPAVMKAAIEGYRETAKDAGAVLSRVTAVERRGRNKQKGGS